MAAGSLPRVATAAVYPRVVAGAACAAGVVLRWYRPESPTPNPDELFTGVYARVPLADMVDRLLARGDTHPPLDYVLRHPFVSGGSVLGLRLVSLVSATAALVVVWAWMRGRGWLGATTVVLTAASPFLVLYGRMARPYSPLILASTVVAVAAERWSAGEDRARLWAVTAGVGVLVGLLLESSAALLVVGCMVLAGRRRDRRAWEWRGAILVSVLVWMLIWGWRIPGQYGDDGARWIPLVGPGDAVVIAGSLVSALHPASAVLVVAAAAVGLVLLRGLDPPLARLCTRLAVVPLVLGLAAAAVLHIGLARSFAALAWAPPLLLAGLVVAAARRSPVLVLPVGVLLAILTVPSLVSAYQVDDGASRAADVVEGLARPGDLVAISPAALDHVVRWTFGTDVIDVAGVTNAAVVPVGGSGAAGGSPGRLWVIGVQGWDGRVAGRAACPGFSYDELEVTVRCFEAPDPVTAPR
jgi:hypothetical protein